MDIKYPKTHEEAVALPELTVSEWECIGPLGPPLEGDTICIFVDSDGISKKPISHKGVVYKTPI